MYLQYIFSNTYFITPVMNHNSYFPIANTIAH